MTPMTSSRRPLTSTFCPTIGWPPKADCHNSCERIAIGGGIRGGCPGAGGGPDTSVSPLANRRPAAGCTPRARSRSSFTDADRTRSGRSAAVRLTSPVVNAPTAENDRLSSRNSRYSGGDTQNCSNPKAGNRVVRYISCPGFGYPSGRRITPLTMEKMAVFAPMPRASVRIVTTVNAGGAQQASDAVAQILAKIFEGHDGLTADVTAVPRSDVATASRRTVTVRPGRILRTHGKRI